MTLVNCTVLYGLKHSHDAPCIVKEIMSAPVFNYNLIKCANICTGSLNFIKTSFKRLKNSTARLVFIPSYITLVFYDFSQHHHSGGVIKTRPHSVANFHL
jgi:hypothetical protein